MNTNKRRRLERAGWHVGNADDFLSLSEEESEYVALKLAMAQGLVLKRKKCGVSQTETARLIRSSQSRVAKMESADASVSLDLLVHTLLRLGTTRRELARMIV